MNKIFELRKIMQAHNVDAYYIANNDEFQNEYLPAASKRLEFLTGFSGSAGELVVTQIGAAFFTDGRYTIQAAAEVDASVFEIYNIKQKTVLEWAAEKALHISYDPWLVTVARAKSFTGKAVAGNLVDAIWVDKPQMPNNPSVELGLEFAGKTSADKIAEIAAELKADVVLITDPISVNWLFNIRGSDLKYTPIKLAYAAVWKTGKAELFEFPKHMEILNIVAERIQIDQKTCPFGLLQNLHDFEIVEAIDPCLLPKAIKNAVEIEGIINAHLDDGLALTNFIHWLKENPKQTEISAAKKLEEFRKEDMNYKAPSFTTISGFGSNGAIVHYSVTEKTNKKFEQNGLYLVDSGGQYCGKDFDISCATTDVTRTIAIGEPTAEMRHDYTLVLKGHIAVAMAEFEPSENNGLELDKLARQFLRAEGKDYDHGTGHGVGHYLNVHEGPCGISPRAKAPFAAGMVISNEPGFYKAGEYGIRIENLVLVVECEAEAEPALSEFQSASQKASGGTKLKFQTLTLAPFDESLIEWEILTNDEKDWIEGYNERISENI